MISFRYTLTPRIQGLRVQCSVSGLEVGGKRSSPGTPQVGDGLESAVGDFLRDLPSADILRDS